MLADVLVSTAWRSGDPASPRTTRTRRTPDPAARDDLPAYRWREGGVQVTLCREAETWVVRVTSTGRLLGPMQTLHQGRHADECHACWDVRARVVRVTRDEEEGLRAGRAAAAWVLDTLAQAEHPAS